MKGKARKIEKMNTMSQIYSRIYQELMQEVINKDNTIFLKEYVIPSINFSPNIKSIKDMTFASVIDEDLNEMMRFFDYNICFMSYEDKYFFSNSKKKVQERFLQELSKATAKELYWRAKQKNKQNKEYER